MTVMTVMTVARCLCRCRGVWRGVGEADEAGAAGGAVAGELDVDAGGA
jgi:hypothetical protein